MTEMYTRRFRRITSLFLDKDELKMALRAPKVSGVFEKRAPEQDKVFPGVGQLRLVEYQNESFLGLN